MATPSFDLLVFGRRKLAEGNGNLTKLRLQIVQRVFNDRRLVYRNRVEANRCHLLLSSIESSHQREQSTQRLQKDRILTDLKREKSSLTRPGSSTSVDLTEPKDFYRFGVRVNRYRTVRDENLSLFFQVQSAAPHVRSTLVNDQRPRSKSISNVSRPFTAPQRSFFPPPSDDVHSDLLVNEEEDETTPRLDRDNEPHQVSTHRITWPIQLKVFALQDDDQSRQQYLAWRAEQRQLKVRRVSKPMVDLQLEQQYQQSIRKRKEIEAFVTSDLIREHQINDPIFAKRYRQLQLAVRTGKVPSYDLNDRNIQIRMSKAQIQRTQTELLIAKQSQIRHFHQQQQKINETQLSNRVHTFLKRLDTFKGNQSEQH